MAADDFVQTSLIVDGVINHGQAIVEVSPEPAPNAFGVDPVELEIMKPSIDGLLDRARARNVVALFAGVSEDGRPSAQTIGNDTLTTMATLDACGTASPAWMDGITEQLMQLGGDDPEEQARTLGRGLTFLQGIQPKNELEAALGVQLFAANKLAMHMAARAGKATTGDGVTLWGGQFNKAARTMATLAEALTKLRSGGKQTVTVKHIHIDARNSQNVIADEVTTGGGKA